MTDIYFYKIVNDLNDKVYIGSTKNPVSRWSSHKASVKKPPKNKCIILDLIIELGLEHFKFKVIENNEYEKQQDWLEREDELIKEYNAINIRCASKKQKVINKKIYQKKYDSQEEVVIKKKIHQKKYNNSEHGKLIRKQYDSQEHRKEINKEHKERHKQTEQYKITTDAYNSKEATKKRKHEWYLKNQKSKMTDEKKELQRLACKKYQEENKDKIRIKRENKREWDRLNCINLCIFE
mgnify:CR=1 FL=1